MAYLCTFYEHLQPCGVCLAFLSNCLYTWNNQRTDGYIFMKSDTGKFYEQLLNHFTLNFHWTILTTILHEHQCVFLFIFRSVTHLIFIGVKKVLNKSLKREWITHHTVLHTFWDNWINWMWFTNFQICIANSHHGLTITPKTLSYLCISWPSLAWKIQSILYLQYFSLVFQLHISLVFEQILLDTSGASEVKGEVILELHSLSTTPWKHNGQ
jgi:hypothetical protein